MPTDFLILAAAVAVGIVLLLPRVARAVGWRATATPLASIIGSGFLVLGPILLDAFGSYAPLMMGALYAVAYGKRLVLPIPDHPIKCTDRTDKMEPVP